MAEAEDGRDKGDGEPAPGVFGGDPSGMLVETPGQVVGDTAVVGVIPALQQVEDVVV